MSSAPLQAPRKFLVIDDNPDGRALLARTLMRKFPRCQVVECEDLPCARRALAGDPIDVVVCHRAGSVSGEEATRELRQVLPRVPIIMVSDLDRTDSAMAAGATCFLQYDAWLMLGPIVSDLLSKTDSSQPWPASS